VSKQKQQPLIVLRVSGIVGTATNEVIREMFKLARKLNVGVKEEINGVHVVVWPSSEWAEEYADWRRRMGWPPLADNPKRRKKSALSQKARR
jgi:hypothetical protein